MIPSNRIHKFYAKIGEKDENGCQNWQGTKFPDRYGAFCYTDENQKYHKKLAHRVEMELNIGRSLLKTEIVRHKCDNPSCVNIEHLVIGTIQDNVDDRVRKNRSAVNKNGEREYILYKCGKKCIIKGLKSWCETMNYPYRTFKRIVIAEKRQYDGWSTQENYIKPPKQPKRTQFLLKHDYYGKILVKNLTKWCKEKNFNRKTFGQKVIREGKKHEGWQYLPHKS
jgi:hypothetical protein